MNISRKRTRLFHNVAWLVALGTICAWPSTGRSAERPGRPDRFGPGPAPGSAAPDFELQTIDGRTLRASALWAGKPVVIMAGSYTCPVFRGKVDGFEKLVRDFSNRVHFIVLYTQEAHPKGDPSPYRGGEWVTPANEKAAILIPQPKTLEERTRRARECAAKLKLTVPVVTDKMDNAAWKAYGSAPNSACLVGRDGKVVERQAWFEPEKMRTAIERGLKSY